MFVSFGIVVTRATQSVWVSFCRIDGRQDDSLIGLHTSLLVYRMRVAPLDQDVLFGAHHEEGRAECEDVEALEIDVAAAHHVEGLHFGRISSRMFTSCTVPSVMRMNVGMFPCRSNSVCILTAALRLRNLA